jgi:hypothetical protein
MPGIMTPNLPVAGWMEELAAEDFSPLWELDILY